MPRDPLPAPPPLVAGIRRWNGGVSTWPHSHASDPRLNDGPPLERGDSFESLVANLFVRCHDCRGGGCDSCSGTGFDWMDTEQARATIVRAVDEDIPARCPKCEGIDFPGVLHAHGCPYDPDNAPPKPRP